MSESKLMVECHSMNLTAKCVLFWKNETEDRSETLKLPQISSGTTVYESLDPCKCVSRFMRVVIDCCLIGQQFDMTWHQVIAFGNPWLTYFQLPS